ncbi:uncharacterized protein YALI1_D34907g [Yarrowia lipolytica]|uniref:Uncharacterized protein n=1 Tax=Yarrowia lipolytica TaxID=4952 RepID=A0A1D8NGB2_YARLL|nr:hypothetical protein YALI1_D34907g [Yarrowia lipolytica]
MKISQNGMRQLPDGVLSEALATRQPGKPRYTNYLQFESMVTASLVVRELHFSVDYRLYNATPQPRRPDRPTVSGEKRWLNLNRPDEQDLVEVKMPLIVAWTERRALRFCTGITPSHFSWKCEVNSILHLSEVLFNCDVKESFTRCYAAFCACYSSSYKPRR